MLSADGHTASEILEGLLELTGVALLADNFEAFARHIRLPHVIETPDKKTVLKTRSALRDMFNRVVQDYTDRNVTKIVRICEVAEFAGPLKIKSTHVTHLMAGNLRVADPIPAYQCLEFIEGRWQSISSQYAVDSKTTVGRALASPLKDIDAARAPSAADASEKRKN